MFSRRGPAKFRPAHWLLLAMLLCSGFLAAAEKTKWHHPASPCRVRYQAPHETGAGGVWIQVPICGMGNADGANVFCFDASGEQLLTLPRGSSTKNRALLQVQAKPDTIFYAYFGSKQPAPKAKIPLAPLCEIYAFPQGKSQDKWPETEAKLKRATLLGRLPLRSLVQISNPITSDTLVAAVLTGFTNFKQETFRSYFLSSDDAGFLLLNNKLRIENPGIHGCGDSFHGENRKNFFIPPGKQELKLVLVNYEKIFAGAVGEYLTSPSRVRFIQESDLIQAGFAEYKGIEAQKKGGCPAFDYTHTTYAGLNPGNFSFTVTEFHSLDGQSLKWHFQDGVQLTGSKVTRVFATLHTQRLRTRAAKESGKGTVTFPVEAPARRLNLNTPRQYAELEKWITAASSTWTDLPQLWAALHFYLMKDLHPRQAILAEKLLQHPDARFSSKEKQILLLAVARTSPNPQRAREAWNTLLQNSPSKKQLPYLIWECTDFLLYRMNAPEEAFRLLERFPQLPANIRLQIQYDIAEFQNRKIQLANLKKQLLQETSGQRDTNAATARGNAAREQFAVLLQNGQILDAEKRLRDWQLESPHIRLQGAAALAKAQILRKRGWHAGTLLLLDATIASDPLLPNLPSVLEEKAACLNAMGKKKEASALQQHIRTEFPNLKKQK